MVRRSARKVALSSTVCPLAGQSEGSTEALTAAPSASIHTNNQEDGLTLAPDNLDNIDPAHQYLNPPKRRRG